MKKVLAALFASLIYCSAVIAEDGPKTVDEAIEKINNLTENDYYDRKDYIDKNYKIAKAYSNYWKMIKKWLEDLIKSNNL